MMKRLLPYLFSVVLVLGSLHITFKIVMKVENRQRVFNQNILTVVDTLVATDRLLLEYKDNQNDINLRTANHLLKHKERLDDLIQTLDLSILKSCGIITDGYGHGSVVAIGPDLLLTAGHCIGYPDSWVEVQGTQYEIIEEWASLAVDVGFVRIDGVLPHVEFGQMSDLLDEVYLVGSPYERDLVNTVTKGIISYLDRDIWQWDDLIQTDAEGASGSSGGPLFDKSGRVIGICVAGPYPGGGVTLCVSVTDIQKALEEYLND